jgi:hypothetical protein
VRDIEVDWRLFSLFLVNEHHEELGPATRASMLFPLRTLALGRREGEAGAMERLYVAIGERLHDVQPRGEMSDDLLRDVSAGAGFDAGLLDRALADPSTEAEVVAEHEALVTQVHAFGVPTIVLPSGRGIFGPVTSLAPMGEAAGELWDHVRWLTDRDDFFELKRIRDRKPGMAA